MTAFPRLRDAEFVVIDTETTGLDWARGDRAFGVAIATPDEQAWYFDLRDDNERGFLQDELPRVRHFVNHHIKFDLHMLRTAGIILDPAKCSCTMVAAALINEHEEGYSLDRLASKYVSTSKVDIWPRLAAIFGGKPDKSAQVGNLPRAPRPLVAEYAIGDVIATLRLWRWQQTQLRLQELEPVYAVESALLGVLLDMERHGVRVDVPAAEAKLKELRGVLDTAKSDLNGLAGMTVNANSSIQVAKLLVSERLGERHWRCVDGTIIESTEGGKPSMGAESLRKIEHPIASLVTNIRSLDKVLNTFITGHILGHEINGRVHCNYNQTKSDNDKGTGTGRISVNSPALQQIHKRDKVIAQYVRACFVPDVGQQWCSIDWSQMDFRVFAHYANEPSIMKMYHDNPDVDYHAAVAQLTGIPRDRTPGTGGGNAKQINLGLVFGMQPGRMAQEMGLPFTEEPYRGGVWKKPGEEAVALFERYHEAVPGVRLVLDRASALAKSRGFVRTILGRRIRFPQGGHYKAGGLVFQGSAADALKVKLVEVHNLLKSTDAHLLLNVHDEFDLSVPPESRELIREVKSCVEKFDGIGTPIKFKVPIRASVGLGANWWEASK